MNALAELLSSQVKAEIFRLLFGVRDHRLHVRELERQSGLAVGTVRQELTRLARLGVVEAQADGNRIYYRANKQHPLYPDIRNLVLKTTGLADVLREALQDAPVRCAFVFGSLARCEDQPQSDIDLMVIGPLGLRYLSKRLAGVAQTLGREINPHVLTVAEFKCRKQKRDHFLSAVLTAPRLFVIGTDHELEAMG